MSRCRWVKAGLCKSLTPSRLRSSESSRRAAILFIRYINLWLTTTFENQLLEGLSYGLLSVFRPRIRYRSSLFSPPPTSLSSDANLPPLPPLPPPIRSPPAERTLGSDSLPKLGRNRWNEWKTVWENYFKRSLSEWGRGLWRIRVDSLKKCQNKRWRVFKASL